MGGKEDKSKETEVKKKKGGEMRKRKKEAYRKLSRGTYGT